MRLEVKVSHGLHYQGDAMAVPLFQRARNRGYHGLDKATEGEWKGPFCFIQGADTQYGMIADFFTEKADTGWQEEIELTRKAIAAANKMTPRPKFFIVCGDLVNAFPGTEGREEQEKDLKREFMNLDSEIPLVCVCGNHDLGNTPTRQTVANYVDKFGDDYFSFWVGGVKFIVLNSQFYEDPSQVMELKEKQDQWLDEQLAGAQTSGCKHLVIFQHIPWFLEDPNEGKDYFNIEKELRLKMLEKFKSAGVRTIFCGHYHRNAGGFYGDMEEVVTSAMGCPLGEAKSGLRVVRILDNSITHDYYAMDDIPERVTLSNPSL
ncbi:serine/threonine-protein phosphatase CPPED1-like [Ptychodera flava]|uniref:serine/threonine-protein phosphatase CPPED1-like n=1 Tax=Ptychodera flava TaxID=63121 RepID=UPI00396A8C47